MGGNLECINLWKTKFQLNCRYSSSLAGSLKSYPILPVQNAYLSPPPPHVHNTIHFQPLCSSLNVLSFLHYASSVFPSAYSVLLFYPTISYYFFITCEDTTSSVKPSLTSLEGLEAPSNHWLHGLTYCRCNIRAYPRRLQVEWSQGYTSVYFCVPWTQNCLTPSGTITNVPWTNE